ncbi:23S rRNA (pseudouridine(1915)-N(3))-methyltransferase RlmH [Candidatus Falkowbacteria bacterium]|uniref:Ribosomal RNA large subunit methyltransferase H n=1 Tax=Candidatus Buchananbacteria bacterium CG10_big_fil_rev_8_21_14_0_10_33_19 TaxID=1974525 RepID=A0A2H0W3H3_9BACT|nr:23S rRNA (pseudouridine(1915)-N(3))-methyltransferase RlmH [Candidatus Falkowbacteria bacterium]PIS05909.1 MAG: hypothetical protein COT80_04030 [Candidatus Buchananbacteria bacterium CG10_big_fil_rev_8_21_14_0_10_33_19]
MLNITLLTIGKIKDKSINDLILEYLKRLKPYAKINIEELKSESFKVDNKNKAKEVEGERILNYLKKYPDSQVILLTENGKTFDSVEFSDFINNENTHFIFVIAGSLGFSKAVENKIKTSLSLSKMTFTHEMARLILLEQIYRAITIHKKKEYHY